MVCFLSMFALQFRYFGFKVLFIQSFIHDYLWHMFNFHKYQCTQPCMPLVLEKIIHKQNKIQHFKESFPKTSPKSLLNIFCFKGWFLKDKLFPKCTPHLFNNLAYNSLSFIKITIIYSLCRRHKREAVPCRGMDCYGYYWQSIFGWWIE